MEYFVEMTTHVPAGTPEEAVDAIRTREAARARELAAERTSAATVASAVGTGRMARRSVCSAAGSDDRLEEALASMPLRVWRTDEVTPTVGAPERPWRRPRPRTGRSS